MQAILKKLLPWHARRTMAFARNAYAHRHPPFAGVYDSFSAIPRSAGYADASWASTSFVAAGAARKQIGAPIPDILPSKWLLPLLIQCISGPVRVLDFGGAAGVDFANTIAALGDTHDVAYHVVDMPGTCAAGRALWAERPNISFACDLPETTARFDIVYAYSAVHCVEDFRDLLRRFAGYRPKAILLCKHPVHTGSSFARAQVNMGKGLELAQWVLGLDDIESTLRDCGYRLTFRSLGEDDYNVDNFDPKHQVGRPANLVFSPVQ